MTLLSYIAWAGIITAAGFCFGLGFSLAFVVTIRRYT